MKKIYVYVGQLRDWMLRMAKNVKGLLGVRVMNKEVIAEVVTCSLDSEETTCFACNSHPVTPYSLYEQRESVSYLRTACHPRHHRIVSHTR